MPVKIQLKDPNHYPSCRKHPHKQEAKEGLQPIVKKFLTGRQWLMPVILATQETEIRRTAVGGQS
jgi:hypothetical protein